MYRFSSFLILLLVTTFAQANLEAYKFDDPVQEQRYKALIAELRCLVCQNQNLAGSNAQLAQDLRRQTYEMVAAGKTEKEVVDYMVQRYGDFVLYRPPMRAKTLLLWIGPFVFLLVAVALLIRLIRKRAVEDEPGLSNAERRVADELLNRNEKS
ncbi:MAG: cytochrome c-type biogenesis protein [bacterium]